MDDLNLFEKSHDQIDSLVNAVYAFNEDIAIEFGIKKCGVLVIKQGKVDKVNSRSLSLSDGNWLLKKDTNTFT